MPLGRVHVIFSGCVQGVGFRFTAKMLASRSPVTGYVKNLADGTVEFVAQGERPEVETLIEEIRSRMRDYVSGASVSWIGPVEGEDGFYVRY